MYTIIHCPDSHLGVNHYHWRARAWQSGVCRRRLRLVGQLLRVSRIQLIILERNFGPMLSVNCD